MGDVRYPKESDKTCRYHGRRVENEVNNTAPASHSPQVVTETGARPCHSVRTILLLLVSACLIPGVIGTAFLFVHDYLNGRDRLERDTILTARALVQDVDSKLSHARAVAQTLASSETLARRDFAAFLSSAATTLALTGVGVNVVLSDSSGQQLINTLRPYGEPLPRHGNPELVQRVLATGQPVISDVYLGGVLKRPVLSIDVPVVLKGRIAYGLSVGVLPDSFQSILKDPRLPDDWVMGIFDSSGTIVARSHQPEKFVGQKATAEYMQRIRQIPEGVRDGTTRDGIQIVSIWSRSPQTGWTVGIGIPRESLEATLRQRLALIAAGFAVLLAACLATAWFVALKISRSFGALSRSALALGAGQPAKLPEVEIAEAREVSAVMTQAGDLLRLRTAALEISEAQFRSTFEQAAVGIAHVDLDGQWLQVNEKLCAIVGYDRQALLALSFQDITYPPDLEADLDFFGRVLAGEIANYSMEKRYVRKDGSLVWINLTVSLVHAPSGNPAYFVSVIEDIQRRKDAEAALRDSEEAHRRELEEEVSNRTAELIVANEKLERTVREDRLTGLQNRASAMERLRMEFLRLKRTARAYAVLFIDIDNFKQINDSYGHEAGDRVLQRVAEAIKATLRETDFVARFGGEEFLAIFPETDAASALAIAEKIRCGVGERIFPGVRRVTISVGVTAADVNDVSEDDAVRRADAALYRAKGDGRNTVRCA